MSSKKALTLIRSYSILALFLSCPFLIYLTSPGAWPWSLASSLYDLFKHYHSFHQVVNNLSSFLSNYFSVSVLYELSESSWETAVLEETWKRCCCAVVVGWWWCCGGGWRCYNVRSQGNTHSWPNKCRMSSQHMEFSPLKHFLSHFGTIWSLLLKMVFKGLRQYSTVKISVSVVNTIDSIKILFEFEKNSSGNH